MKKKLTNLICILLSLTFVLSVSASAVNSTDEMTEKLSSWLIGNISVSESDGEIDSYLDWTVFAMSRNGYTVFNNNYKAYIEKAVKENESSLYLNDLARISLAAMSVGMDAKAVGNVNLIERIEKYNFSDEIYTGSIAYALIALDASKSENNTAREELKSILVSAQRKDGGFNSFLAADEAMSWTLDGETDSTGIVLQALAPYKSESDISALISSAVSFVKVNQMDDGGFGAWGAGSAESTSMILAGLCAIGESVDSSEYIKNKKTIVDALSDFINGDGGGRCYDSSSNIMTTYQMLMGLSAYERQRDGKISLFDMSCLSPKCNSIEHGEFFEKHPILGRIVCTIVSFIYTVLGREYYCCKHG